MKQLICIYFFFLSTFQLFGQVEYIEKLPFNGNVFNALIVKVDPETIKKFTILENNGIQTHEEVLGAQQIINPSFFLMNASISDSTCRPIGYYVKNYQQIQPVNLGDGSGNFYLKPNGALLMTSTEAIICKSEDISNYQNISLGIQSGPMLIANDLINPQFNINSINKNIRCGVGVFTNSKNDQFLVFAISESQVTFYEFANLFQNKFKCKNALCLESAGCAFYLPGQIPNTEMFNGVICNYIYLRL